MSQKGTRKSRSGCLACRAKRIKCDETKPQCTTCTSRRHQCPGYQQPLKWSTKYEVDLKNKPRESSISIDAAVDIWPIISEQTSSPRQWQDSVLGPQRTELQTMPATLSSTTLIGGFENPEFTAADVLTPGGTFVTDYPSGPVTGCYADMAMAVDAGLTQHDFGESAMWMGASQWLDDLQSLDAFSIVNLESYISTSMPSIESRVDSQVVQFERPSPVGTDDQEQKSSGIAHKTDHESMSQAISQTGVRLYRSSTPQTLTHTPTFLIDYWFNTVCATWNGFDSVKNMNRNMALETFQHSEGLAYSLQSMAAAYLAEHLPHFRETTITMTQAAVYSIRRELTQRTSPSTLPRHLLLSMFCIGTSACWTDPLQFGLPFLKEIKAILKNYNLSKATLSPADQNALTFFNISSMYWDMLCSIIGAETTGTLDPPVDSPLPKLKDPEVLHPWTGVSPLIFVLFSESISLCRRFRLRMAQDHRATIQSLQAALRDIEHAQKLQQRLESFLVPNEWDIADTEDKLTPNSHLVQIADAYRLGALAHLRQTFPDLTSERAFEYINATVDTDDQVLDLGLEIVRILEKIPLTSGTRCIQPLLCLTAGIVLKLDVASLEPQQHALNQLNGILSTDLRSASVSTLQSPLLEGHPCDTSPALEITERSIEVGQARRFVLERFSVLESSLPSKPIRVARQLVQTVWAAYDRQSPHSNQVHWIDIMAQFNLRTIFG